MCIRDSLYSVEHGGITTLCRSEWDIIKHLTDVLKFFCEATLDLSYNDARISIIIPLLSLLNRKLQVRCENEDETVANMRSALHESLNKKFSYVKGHPSLMAATLLDPRFKSKYLTSDEVDIAMSEIIEFLKGHNDCEVVDRDNVPSSSAEPILPATNIQQEKESLWDTHDHDSDQIQTQ